MATAYDSSAIGAEESGALSKTFSHTCGVGATSMVVGVSCSNTIAVSTVTYNGVGLTKVDSLNVVWTGSNLDVWKTTAAPASGAHDVVVTMASGTPKFTAISVSFTGSATADPVRASLFEYDGVGADPETATLAGGSTDDIVVDFYLWRSLGVPTEGAGQTLRQGQRNDDDGPSCCSSTKAGAASVTTSWTSGFGNYGGQALISVKAGGGRAWILGRP